MKSTVHASTNKRKRDIQTDTPLPTRRYMKASPSTAKMVAQQHIEYHNEAIDTPLNTHERVEHPNEAPKLTIAQDYSRADDHSENSVMKNRLSKLLGHEYQHLIDRFHYDGASLQSMTKLSIGRLICFTLKTHLGISPRAHIIDAFAGIGGNTIMFAKEFRQVNAIEIDENRVKMLHDNARLFKVVVNTQVHCGYYQSFIGKLKQDVVFFDPPWGVGYKKIQDIRIRLPRDDGGSDSLEDLILATSQYARYIVVKIPINYDHEYLASKIDSALICDCMLDCNHPYSSRILFLRVIRDRHDIYIPADDGKVHEHHKQSTDRRPHRSQR